MLRVLAEQPTMARTYLLGTTRWTDVSFASGPVNVPHGHSAPRVSAQCWMDVGVARAAPDRLEIVVMRGMYATPTRACTVTSPGIIPNMKWACALVSITKAAYNIIFFCFTQLEIHILSWVMTWYDRLKAAVRAVSVQKL